MYLLHIYIFTCVYVYKHIHTPNNQQIQKRVLSKNMYKLGAGGSHL
jgi:hypothetical protein